MNNLLTIRVFQEKNTIKIAFEDLSLTDPMRKGFNKLPMELKKDAFDLYYLANREDPFQTQILQDLFSSSNQFALEQSFEFEKKSAVLIETKKEEVQYTAVIYTLSTTPHAALHWLGCMSIYFNIFSMHYDHIQFKKSSILDTDLQIPPSSIQDYIVGPNVTGKALSHLLEEILNFKDSCGCFLLKMSTNPTEILSGSLSESLQERDGCILFEDHVFYFDQSEMKLLALSEKISLHLRPVLDDLVVDKLKIPSDKKLRLISALTGCHSYKETMKAVKKINSHYQVNRSLSQPIPFLKFLHIKTRFQIQYGTVPETLLNEHVKLATKIKLLLTFTSDLINKNQQAELNFFLTNLNYLAKRTLFSLCLDKPSYDAFLTKDSSKKYDWHYTEWSHFLRYAKFSLLPDGRIGIVDIKNNVGYLKHYAIEKAGHPVFEEEMRALVDSLDLEIAADTLFHEKIIFTEKCTEKLKAMGLLYNGDYVKKLLFHRNKLNFFYRSTPITEDKNLLKIPESILENIIERSTPSPAGVDPVDLIEVGQSLSR